MKTCHYKVIDRNDAVIASGTIDSDDLEDAKRRLRMVYPSEKLWLQDKGFAQEPTSPITPFETTTVRSNSVRSKKERPDYYFSWGWWIAVVIVSNFVFLATTQPEVLKQIDVHPGFFIGSFLATFAYAAISLGLAAGARLILNRIYHPLNYYIGTCHVVIHVGLLILASVGASYADRL